MSFEPAVTPTLRVSVSPKEELFEDAVDAISSAIALGMPVTAIAGMTVFEAGVGLGHGEYTVLGLYSSQETAWDAVRDFLVSEWAKDQYAIWLEPNPDDKHGYDSRHVPNLPETEYDGQMIAWLMRTSRDDVISAYSWGELTVREVQILGDTNGTPWYAPSRKVPYIPWKESP